MSAALARLAVVLALVLSAGPFAPSLRAAEIGPEDDLCRAINALAPGDELVLRGGDYAGPCAIRRGGVPGAPVVIRAADPAQPPRIVHPGLHANALDIRANHVTVRGLHIGPTRGDVDGIRIYAREGITVEECTFTEVSGIAVVANHSSVRGLTVRRNIVLRSRATAMYFGCHDGTACEMSDLLVEGNYIHRAGHGTLGVGYGVQVKLNSTGIIRDNVIVDTKGPPIMIYGSRSLDRLTLVERNFVMGSLESSGIVVAGGPVVVRNNVATGNADAGIGLEDYGHRGLLRAIVVAHNTVYDNGQAGIAVPAGRVRDLTVVNNAVHSAAAALPRPAPGISLRGNVDCSLWTLCFANPEARDFTPGALLIGPAAPGSEKWMPVDDYFWLPRGSIPTVGAIERGRGPIMLGPRGH